MANSDYIIYALVLVVCLDLVFFLAQAGVTTLNPDGTVFYNCEGGLLDSGGNCSALSTAQDYRDKLPDATKGLEPTTENIFTDIFTSITSFFIDKTGLGDVFLIFAGPAVFFSAVGLPAAFTFAIGAAWVVVTFFLIIIFLWGR